MVSQVGGVVLLHPQVVIPQCLLPEGVSRRCVHVGNVPSQVGGVVSEALHAVESVFYLGRDLPGVREGQNVSGRGRL